MSKNLTERCKTKKVELVPRNVVVRELTVAEVEDVFSAVREEGIENIKLHILDMLYNLPFPARVVAISAGEDLDALVAEFTQEELAAIIEAVEEVNHRLKKMFGRLVEVGQKMLTAKASPSPLPG